MGNGPEMSQFVPISKIPLLNGLEMSQMLPYMKGLEMSQCAPIP